jgi:hypothetical protein
VDIDRTQWSGEGSFTEKLLAVLGAAVELVGVRVEDAPATRSDADYNFISNEVFVQFQVQHRREKGRRFGLLPVTRIVTEKVMTLDALGEWLGAREGIGPADYTDEGMLQYLRTERIVPPYQTRGYKLVELVRIYEVGGAAARAEL